MMIFFSLSSKTHLRSLLCGAAALIVIIHSLYSYFHMNIHLFSRYYCMDDKVCVCNACTIEGGHLGHTIKTLKNTMKDLKVC